jgi:hypothetical protein
MMRKERENGILNEAGLDDKSYDEDDKIYFQLLNTVS